MRLGLPGTRGLQCEPGLYLRQRSWRWLFLRRLGSPVPSLPPRTVPFPSRVRRDLWLDFPDGLKLYKKQGDGHVTAQAQNCESLTRLSEDGYYGGGSPDISVQSYQLSVCQAVALLGQAKPARVSYLHDFVLNKDAVNYLPAMVNIYASCTFVCRAFNANKRGVPLAKFDEIERLEITDKNGLIVWTGAWRIEMTGLPPP